MPKYPVDISKIDLTDPKNAEEQAIVLAYLIANEMLRREITEFKTSPLLDDNLLEYEIELDGLNVIPNKPATIRLNKIVNEGA